MIRLPISRWLLPLLQVSSLLAYPRGDAPASQSREGLRSEITALYERQSHVKSFSRAVLSPDGRQIAWSVDAPETRGVQFIYVASIAHPDDAKRVTAGEGGQPCYESDPVWSHDGRQLAFLSNCRTSGQVELFVMSMGSVPGQARQLTHLAGFLSRPEWSPDGENIALLFVEHASRAPTPMAAENKPVGAIDDLVNTDVQRLAIVNVGTSETRQVTPAALYIFEYDWSPDGRSFAYSAAPPPGDDNWYIARLYTQPCRDPKPLEIFKPPLQIALPRWSPDGKSIAFIAGLMSDEGGTGGEIYTVPASGGAPRDLTAAIGSSLAWFTWLSDQEMLFTQFVGGSTAIGTLDVARASVRSLWQGAETIHSGPDETSVSVARRGATLETALVRDSWSTLPEVWAGPIGEWKRLTQANASVDVPLPKSENIGWKNGGFGVQGWLLYPKDYDPAKRYPLLVIVHGGPAWIATPTWRAPDFDTTLYTNFGYFVFFPNARGSYGQGEKFTQANRRDWGFGDLQDMLAGVDAVSSQYPIDSRRIGILGWSYGGSTAMMAITQTNRFRAAVAGAGAGNWQSYYGQNSIDKWMIPYFGASVYDDPAAYARCSAITYIKNAKTPTLVLVGERDGEAPPAQSIEFWHALKELGVPTRLIIYPDEGHDFFKQADQIDVTVRTLEWFNEHMATD